MARIQAFDDVKLRSIRDILGDTSSGLSGSEISQLLQSCSIPDPNPTQTKRYRLFEALSQQQVRGGCGNQVGNCSRWLVAEGVDDNDEQAYATGTLHSVAAHAADMYRSD
jgi:hypothetical protein